MRPSLPASALASALALALLACGGGTHAGDGVGIVRALGAERRSVTLEHADVPGVMKSMTMEYAVARPELLAGIEIGEPVAFHLVDAGGVYTVTELRERKP